MKSLKRLFISALSIGVSLSLCSCTGNISTTTVNIIQVDDGADIQTYREYDFSKLTLDYLKPSFQYKADHCSGARWSTGESYDANGIAGYIASHNPVDVESALIRTGQMSSVRIIRHYYLLQLSYDFPTYSITYYLNGGAFERAAIESYTYDQYDFSMVKLAEALPTPVLTSRAFDCWVDANGMPIDWANIEPGDLHLYARYAGDHPLEEGEYNIYYDVRVGGKDLHIKDPAIHYNAAQTYHTDTGMLPLYDYGTLDGAYTHNGWKVNGGEDSIKTLNTNGLTGDITLTIDIDLDYHTITYRNLHGNKWKEQRICYFEFLDYEMLPINSEAPTGYVYCWSEEVTEWRDYDIILEQRVITYEVEFRVCYESGDNAAVGQVDHYDYSFVNTMNYFSKAADLYNPSTFGDQLTGYSIVTVYSRNKTTVIPPNLFATPEGLWIMNTPYYLIVRYNG